MNTTDIQTKEFNYGSPGVHVIKYKPRVREHMLPLILVHGIGADSTIWEHYAAFFAKEGWETYTLDLRGHGKSKGDSGSIDDYVDDVHAVVEEALLGSTVIIGHDTGGFIALKYAKKHDPAAIVPISTPPTEEIIKNSDEPIPAVDLATQIEDAEDLSDEQKKKLADVVTQQEVPVVSISKNTAPRSTLFIGAENGKYPTMDTVRTMAKYYRKDVVQVSEASHFGTALGSNWKTGAAAIDEWLSIQFEADFSDMDMDLSDLL